MRKHLFILLLLGVFIAVSCHKELGPGEETSGFGSIELCFDSRNAIGLQTRTDLEEGLEFSNVLVVLVNNSDNVVDKKYVVEGSSVSSKVVSFTGLLPGSYHVYAYANIDADAWQQSGENLISAKESTLTAGTSFASFVGRELATLTGTDVPSDPSTSMLLTGHKEVSVGLTTVTDTLDLLRPVVRFKVTVRNHTPFPIQVDELRFSHFNADRAYLLDHRDASGVPSMPAAVTYRAMPAFDPSGMDDNSVAASADEVIYQRLVYENAYSGTYKIFAALTLDRSSEHLPTLTTSSFGVIDYNTLNQMNEGDKVDVLVVNPQINVRSGRIFCYISSDNKMAWESAGYDTADKFLARAQAIWNEEATYDYSANSSYTGTNSNGYSIWDGINANAALNSTSFSYTGKKSQYFHTLTKSNGRYSIAGLATSTAKTGGVSIIANTPLANMRIEEGHVNNASKIPSTMEGKLVRFINDSNIYLVAEANYSNSPVKESVLRWEGGGTNQDRQFVLYGRYVPGAPLKRILKENNKEVPLTYMARNEEINVILNVYYSDQVGTINFAVDNSTWGTPTTSSHTFN